ncbi:hypothetical protein GE09DRAFT_1068428 [Coniochaeta sp. 2T2.1]|nr:hypothetical protein GE09DRAFT_1068428 [Coniochaeta sp. 2T2.1]
MAARPGEENVAVLFADIHYFYGPPEEKPRHHRFDKGSYVYLFEDANQGRARVEIANLPGTDDQDAFDGYLDTTHLRYSYKQTCVVTLTVGDVPGQEEWHLPTYDPSNQNKYHYKLHSLDIYFWTQQDALSFVNGIRRVVAPSQCEILDEPGPPPRQHHPADVSSVVQQLEKAAIADTSSPASNQPGIPSFAPPPQAPPPGSDAAASPAPAFVPIPYNPAAPPAPEQVRHREKTPPPEDGGLNPLHATLAHDATTPFSPGLVPPAGYGSPIGPGPLSPAMVPPQHFLPPPSAPQFPGPPIPAVAPVPHQYPSFGSLGAAAASPTPPPVHPGLARAATMPVAAHQHPHIIGAYPQSPGFAPPGTPGLASPGLASPGLPPATAPPVGGYAGYNYAAAGGQPPVQDYTHQQAYRPTAAEVGPHTPKREAKGKLEENAGRLERGVTGMFKKFEKKFG